MEDAATAIAKDIAKAKKLTRQGWIGALLSYGVEFGFQKFEMPSFSLQSNLVGCLLFGLSLFCTWRCIKGWFWQWRYGGLAWEIGFLTLLTLPIVVVYLALFGAFG